MKPGQVVAGKYRLKTRLGMGGMGEVWSAVHTGTDRDFAIKFMHAHVATSETSRERFAREAKISAKIAHPNVIDVFDVGETDEGGLYLAMELLDGGSLADAFHADPTLVVRDFLAIARDAASALAAAHAVGVVHRDVKPENLFLHRDRKAGTTTVKLLDFGISKYKASGDEAFTKTSAVLGSPRYMSPEQTRSATAADHRADIWALGVILFEGLTGTWPHEGDGFSSLVVAVATTPPKPIDAVAPHLPEPLRAIVRRCLASLDQRYASASEVAAHLDVVLRDPSLAAMRLPKPRGAVAGVSSHGATTSAPTRAATPSRPEAPPALAARPTTPLESTALLTPGTASWPGNAPSHGAPRTAPVGAASPVGALTPHGGPTPLGAATPYGSPTPHGAPAPYAPAPPLAAPPPYVTASPLGAHGTPPLAQPSILAAPSPAIAVAANQRGPLAASSVSMNVETPGTGVPLAGHDLRGSTAPAAGRRALAAAALGVAVLGGAGLALFLFARAAGGGAQPAPATPAAAASAAPEPTPSTTTPAPLPPAEPAPPATATTTADAPPPSDSAKPAASAEPPPAPATAASATARAPATTAAPSRPPKKRIQDLGSGL
jgi:serine/threonine-protein kinase